MMNLLIRGEAGQRALEETVADWRESRAKTHGTARVWCELQGVVSVARVLVGVGLREMTDAGSVRSAAITVGIAVLATAVFLLATMLALDAAMLLLESPGVILAWLAGFATFAFPLAATFGLGWSRIARPPVLGSLGLVVIVQIMFLSLVIPATNSFLWERLDELIKVAELGTGSVIEMPRLPTGVDILLSAHGLALIAAVPVLTLFGAAVRRSLRHRAHWVRQAVTGLLLTTLITAVYSAWVWLDSLVIRYWPRRGLIPEALWSIVVLAAVLTFVIARRSRSREDAFPS